MNVHIGFSCTLQVAILAAFPFARTKCEHTKFLNIETIASSNLYPQNYNNNSKKFLRQNAKLNHPISDSQESWIGIFWLYHECF